MIKSIFLFLSVVSTLSAWEIQKVSTFEKQTELDSNSVHTWWMTDREIDPVAFTKSVTASSSESELEKNFKPVKIPTVGLKPADFSKGVVPGEMWLAKAVIFPSDSTPAILTLGWISDRDEVFLNGQKIGSSGVWNAERPQAYDKQRMYPFSQDLIKKDSVNVILIHVKGFFPEEIGILKNETLVGPAQSMMRDFYIYNFREAGLLVLYFTAGSYFLFLFIRRRRERENLYFGIFTWTLVVYQFLRTQFKHILGWDFYFAKKVEYLALLSMVPLFYFFLKSYFEFPDTRFFKWWHRVIYVPLVVLAATGILIAASGDVVLWDKLNKVVVQPAWIPIILSMLGIVGYKIFKKDRDALFMSFGLVALILAMVIDILSTRNIINVPRVMGYAFIFFIMGLALILANRFVRLSEQIEDLNVNLENKVETRTRELNNSLLQINRLKMQQDGDYFLTSLLLKPLGGLFGVSKTVKADYYLDQKKKFHFKKWSSEIGGDLVTSYSIQLRNRNCTVFLNADAMGKSVQGAGGALVLGTVFKNVVVRTQMSPEISSKFPEQWLKECFIELQNVFESFDGSMLASAVIALIDDETGLLYHVNAEHPWTVLYQNGKASYIEDELYLRKLGIGGVTGSLRIQTLQLEPGDVIIMGSDGRDDLAVGTDEKGLRIINEDYSLFLRAVEEGKGDLALIASVVRGQGEITDDFSLLRISYREDGDGGEIASGREMAFASARSLLDQGKFAAAANAFIEYCDVDPSSTQALVLAALSLKQASGETGAKKSDLLKSAADYGERARLREPTLVKNLVNLSDIYRLIGNMERAKMILEKAREIDPKSPDVNRLSAALRV